MTTKDALAEKILSGMTKKVLVSVPGDTYLRLMRASEDTDQTINKLIVSMVKKQLEN